MTNLTYSISFYDHLSKDQYNKIVLEFKEIFKNKGFEIVSLKKMTGSTIIEFGLKVIQNNAVFIGVSTITFFIIRTFAKEIIKKIVEDKCKKGRLTTSEMPFEKLVISVAHHPRLIEGYDENDVLTSQFCDEEALAERHNLKIKALTIKHISEEAKFAVEMSVNQETGKRNLKMAIDIKNY